MKKVHYSWQQLEGAVLELARQINASGWTPEYIIGISRGGVTPANMLSQYLGIKMYVIHVSLRDHVYTESNCWLANDAFESENILIVDDINDSGETFNWIMQDWQSNCIPTDPRWANDVWHENVKFATIFNNLGSTVEVDFAVEEIDKREEDTWIVFPWEEFWKK
jgi:hypoxanthine phosphoribosyltransferase